MTKHTSPRPLGAVALAAAVVVAATGCAHEQESLGSIKSSADTRLHGGRPAPRSDETAEKLLKSPLTADGATRVALLNNRRVHAAYEELGIARGALVHALRLPNPELEGAIRFSEDEPELELRAMLGLSELLFLPWRSDAANTEVEAARTEVVSFIVTLAFDVRAAFYEYQAALQRLELSRTVLQATEAAAEAAARLHDAGNLTDLDFANEHAFAEEARVVTRRADTDAAEARAHLSALMGVSDAAASWSAAGRLADPPREERSLAALERQALARSLALEATRKRAEAANQRATAESVERWLPGLKAGVSAHREEHWAVGPVVALEVPLFYQGQGNIDAARAEERRQKHLGTAGTMDIRNAAHTAVKRLSAARENALRYRDVLLPLRKRILDETELHYNAMAVGVFQLLAAKRDQIETSRAYVEALLDYWLCQNDVERIEAGGASVH